MCEALNCVICFMYLIYNPQFDKVIHYQFHFTNEKPEAWCNLKVVTSEVC